MTKITMAQTKKSSPFIVVTLIGIPVLLCTLVTTEVAADPERATKATYEQPELPRPKSKRSTLELKLKKNNSIDNDLAIQSQSHRSEKEIGSPGESPYSAIQTLGSLLFVLTLFGCVAYWMRRGGTRSNQLLSGEAWEILGRGTLGPKHDVQLVRLGNRLLLVGYSPHTIQTLVEITDPEEVQSMLTSCHTKRPQFSGGFPKKLFAALSGKSELAFERIDQNTNPAYVEPKDA